MKHDDTYRNVELDVHASVPSLAWQFAQHAGDAIAVIEQGILYLAHGDAPPAKWPVVTRNAWPVTLALYACGVPGAARRRVTFDTARGMQSPCCGSIMSRPLRMLWGETPRMTQPTRCWVAC